MSIVDFWIVCVAVIAAYAIAVLVVAVLCYSSEDETEDNCSSEASRDAFRKWFRFAN